MPCDLLIVISGPVGVGKTTVAEEASAQLDQRGIAHKFIDLDALGETYPQPHRLTLANLSDVWANCADGGSRTLIVSHVVEAQSDVTDLEGAVSSSKTIVIQLRASDANLLDRVQRRELGSGLARHEKLPLELATILQDAPADFVVETDGRSIIDIAGEILGLVENETGIPAP